MITLDTMVENGDIIKVLPNTILVPIADIDELSKGCTGYITYRVKGSSEYRRQRFYLEVDGDLYSELKHREIDFIVSLGEMFERHFKALGMMVVELSLPVSHGYCGRSYGYHTTKRLFSGAGIKGFGKKTA